MTIRHTTRSEEAEVRKESRIKLTHVQQVDLLDRRLGTGIGAKKERAKLKKLIEKGKQNAKV